LIKNCKGGDIISDRYLALQNRVIEAEKLLTKILIYLDMVHDIQVDMLETIESFLRVVNVIM